MEQFGCQRYRERNHCFTVQRPELRKISTIPEGKEFPLFRSPKADVERAENSGSIAPILLLLNELIIVSPG